MYVTWHRYFNLFKLFLPTRIFQVVYLLKCIYLLYLFRVKKEDVYETKREYEEPKKISKEL